MKTIDFYDDAKWKKNGERAVLEQREEIALGIIANKLKDGAKVLDVGCGDGFFLSTLAGRCEKQKPEFYGIDYSGYKIARAKDRHPFIFKQCNLEEGIPFSDKYFDLVYSGEVIEHLYNPDLMLSECFRVLKDDGYLLVSTPNMHAWYNRALFIFGIQPIFYEVSTVNAKIGVGPLRRFKKDEVPVGHVRLFGWDAIHDILTHNNFEVKEVHGWIFEGFPSWLKKVDNIMRFRPSLASGMLLLASKKAAL